MTQFYGGTILTNQTGHDVNFMDVVDAHGNKISSLDLHRNMEAYLDQGQNLVKETIPKAVSTSLAFLKTAWWERLAGTVRLWLG